MLRAAIDHPKFGRMIFKLRGCLIAADIREDLQRLNEQSRAKFIRELIACITDDPIEQVFLYGEALSFCRSCCGSIDPDE